MPEICLTPLSYSSRGAASIVAAHLLVASPILLSAVRSEPLAESRVVLSGEVGTFDARRNPLVEMVSIPKEETSLIEFYSNFLSQQEELGEDFAGVLFNNLWDLYAR